MGEKGCVVKSAFTLVLWLGAAAIAQAQATPSYPTKPIKLVVGSPAGGSTDVVTRQVAEPLARNLGQPVIIENRPGGSGIIAARLVASAAPDGYTLLVCNSGTHGGNSVMFTDLGYDPIKDFTPVVLWVTVPFIVVVNPSAPVTSIKDFVNLAKANPGKLKFGFAGAGGYNHIAGELFQHLAGIQLVPVAYKGLNEVITDVAGAHIDVGFPTPGESLPMIAAGRLRALAVTGPRRLAALPNVATIAEAGFPEGELLGWGGTCAPAGTPPEVIKKLNEQTLAALFSPQLKSDFERRGYELRRTSPEDFRAFITSEIARIGKLVQQLGIRAQ
jgi:tripartite-type tricarboxylate transporter receptor subunit TctC